MENQPEATREEFISPSGTDDARTETFNNGHNLRFLSKLKPNVLN